MTQTSSSWQPRYTITPAIARGLMAIEAARAVIAHTPLSPVAEAELRHRARIRSTHYSTRIEGNRLTLAETERVIAGAPQRFQGRERDVREVQHYWNALLRVEEWAAQQKPLTEDLIRRLHALVEKGARAKPTSYRDGQNGIREAASGAIIYLPPEAKDVPALMQALVAWVPQAERENLPTPLIAALVHYQFVTLHPYYDGNGRAARLLATFILHRGGYGLNGFFSLEEHHARDLAAYYGSLVTHPHHNYYEGRAEADLTPWLAYFIETLANVFTAAQNEALHYAEEGGITEADAIRKLDHRARTVLALFAHQETITATQIANTLGISARMARNLAQTWVADGWLLIVNSANRTRTYGLSAIYRQSAQPKQTKAIAHFRYRSMLMQFGLFYEHQLPRPWREGDEQRLFQEALDQVELADRLGIEYVWEVEHHFLEEYSHSSAPEVFLAACSQRTKQMRLGHGIVLMPPNYNHPARVAERIATLDLISNGRVEWGTGKSSSRIELEGFNIDPEQRQAMWLEAVHETAKMLCTTPYPGYNGQHFSMPPRNIVPKPVQKPHPPLWMACSNRATILEAARLGVGALCFAFVDAADAKRWVSEYYETFKHECQPIGQAVNPNVAMVAGFMCHEDSQTAVRQGLEGFQFFGYALSHYYIHGTHQAGAFDLWADFQQNRPARNEPTGCIGNPAQVRATLEQFEEMGVDQVIFIQQAGHNRQEDICRSLELFGAQILPEFKTRHVARAQRKAEALAPYVAQAMRKIAPLSAAEAPLVEAYPVLTRKLGLGAPNPPANGELDGGAQMVVAIAGNALAEAAIASERK